MSLARAIFRTMRRLPVLRGIADFIIREGRNVFWAWRRVNKTHAEEIPQPYLDLLTSELGAAPPSFQLLEIGSGDGRILCRLSRLFPHADFTGIDLQKAAVEFGNTKISNENLSSRARIVLGSCLDPKVCRPCDYLTSRTALIYLNAAEIRTFLQLYLPMVRKGMILQEVVSTSGTTERSHYFAHPLAALIREIGGADFEVKEHIVEYGPWKGPAWSGANIIATRRA